MIGINEVTCILFASRIDHPAASIDAHSELHWLWRIATGSIVCVLLTCWRHHAFEPPAAGTAKVVLRACGLILVALMATSLLPNQTGGGDLLAVSCALGVQLIVLSRSCVPSMWRDVPFTRTIIFGTGELAQIVARELRTNTDSRLRLVGFIKEETFDSNPEPLEGPVLGTAAAIESIIRQYGVSRVIVAPESGWGVLPIPALARLRFDGVTIEEAQSTLSVLTGRISLSTVKPAWLAFATGFRRSPGHLVAKRVLDVIASAAGLVLTMPLMLMVAIAIKLESDGPVLYRQTRVGWRARTFEVLKFRSMRVDAERHGAVWASVGDPRVTRIGKFIRKFRIDELPQFVNVLMGHMSLVGPRPERPMFVEELRKRIEYYDERHSMRPGLTGWAQVRYPYGASVEDAYRKLEYDLFYLQHASVRFDLFIIAATLRVVLEGRHGR